MKKINLYGLFAVMGGILILFFPPISYSFVSEIFGITEFRFRDILVAVVFVLSAVGYMVSRTNNSSKVLPTLGFLSILVYFFTRF